MHCMSCALKRKVGKPLLFKQTLRSRFTCLACQHFSFDAQKSLDRERPFSLALRVVSLFSCLSRLAVSVTRVVICVSRAFCSTDQEKRETARSLSLLSSSLSEWPINTTIGSRRSLVLFFMMSFTSLSALWDDAVTLVSLFSRLVAGRVVLTLPYVLCCDILRLLGKRLAVRLAVSQCHQLNTWSQEASCLILIINVQNEHAVIHNLKGRQECAEYIVKP